jgi:hypothetical protein
MADWASASSSTATSPHGWIAVPLLKAGYVRTVGYASDGGADARVGNWSSMNPLLAATVEKVFSG